MLLQTVQTLLLFCRKCHQLSKYKSNYDIFTKYFGLSHSKAKNYINTHNFEKFNPESTVKTIQYCKTLGYKNEDLLETPVLLKTNSITVEQHFMVMTEGGFCKITPILLSKFLNLHRRIITDLKEFQLLKPRVNVAESFISYLDPKPEGFSVKYDENSDSWSQVHLRVLIAYLQWRLQTKREEITKLLRIHETVLRKSFRYYCQNMNFAFELGFTPAKLLKHGYILKTYPPYTREILEKFPNLAGTDMRKEMVWYPKLISTSPKNIEKIYKILKKNNISDCAIRQNIGVFTLSPETVEYRLDELERVSDLRVLLTNTKILRLVVHFGRANKRLDFLKEKDWKCSGFNVLSKHDELFDAYLKEGRDINTRADCFVFLKNLLNFDDCQYFERLKLHPFYLQIPFVLMEDTYVFLRANNFDNECILNAIYILLYPRKKIQEAFKTIESIYRDKSNLSPLDTLNLVLYFIEKEYHFTGNGIWSNNEIIDENMLQ